MSCSLNLFGGNGSVEDVWDDTELIQHFDQALETSRKLRKKEEVLEADKPGSWKEVSDGEQELEKLTTKGRRPMILNSQNSNQIITHQWQVGSTCRTIYSEDNVEYEAKIVEVSENICIVRFVGYGNEEEVQISSLKPSLGKQARDLQRIQALQLVSLGTVENGHEEVQEQESPDNEKPSTSAAVAVEEEDPEKYDELRERVRLLIQARCRAGQEQQEEDEALTQEAQQEDEPSEYQHHRFPQLNPRRKCRRRINLEDNHTHFSTIYEGRAKPVHEPPPQLQNNPSASNANSQEWTQSFPNLFMPPMPSSLANSDGQFNFGKGQMPALLMSWYMAGYHAGAFDAKREFQKSRVAAGGRARGGGSSGPNL